MNHANNVRSCLKTVAFTCVIALRIQEILNQKVLSKALMAKRMKPRRTSVNRRLDTGNPSLTFDALPMAAAYLGHAVRLALVPMGPKVSRQS